MKMTPKKVFVLENGNYIELTYEELCSREQTIESYKDKLFLPLHGMLMEVTEEDYIAFYKAERRRRYVVERDVQNGVFSYEDYTTEEFNGEDMLVDNSVNIEEEVEQRFIEEKIQEFLGRLSEKDREIIIALYFEGLTEREYAKKKGIYHNAVHDRKLKVLRYLKNFLEN